MQPPKDWERLGTFQVGEIEVPGELSLDGALTRLRLFHSTPLWGIDSKGPLQINGTLANGIRVSLLECVGLNASTRGSASLATLFPHFVIYGDQHFANTEPTIQRIDFELEDGETLFYDFDAYSSHEPAPELAQMVIEAQRKRMSAFANEHGGGLARPIPDAGAHAIVAYFAGRTDIAEAKTAFGRVDIGHRPGWTTGGPTGVSIDGHIVVSVSFQSPAAMDAVIEHTESLLRFFDLLIGRQQHLKSFAMRCESANARESNTADRIEVYWPLFPTRKHAGVEPRTWSVMMNPIERPRDFAVALENWSVREPTWKDARARFSNCFRQQNNYSVDRLVAAANMFDILPDSEFSPADEVSEDLKSAVDKCTQAIKALPNSSDRSSVLGALGRVGTLTLKRKVRARAVLVLSVFDTRLPALLQVLDLAINCRNHYVHGTKSRIDYAAHFFATTAFFTDALEFTFGVSDIMSCGWDATSWRPDRHHQLGQFVDGYSTALSRLENIVGAPVSRT